MLERNYYVYFLTNFTNSTLYIGVTNNLLRRIQEHKAKQVQGFAQKYNLTKLIYFEVADDAYSAISREKQLKKWSRAAKEKLITTTNPEKKDLYPELMGES